MIEVVIDVGKTVAEDELGFGTVALVEIFSVAVIDPEGVTVGNVAVLESGGVLILEEEVELG